MSEEMTPAPKVGAGRGIKIALAVSLALNLAIVGLVGGVVLGRSGGGEGGGPPRLHALGLGPFAMSMAREDRDELRARIGRGQGDEQTDRRAIWRAFGAVQEALRADPFDRAAAEAALAQSRDAAQALQSSGHAAFLDYVAEMPLEARIELADSLNRTLRRGSRLRGE